jgi:hypothetical protein
MRAAHDQINGAAGDVRGGDDIMSGGRGVA